MIRRLQIGLVVAAAVAVAGWSLWRWYAPETPITQAAYTAAQPEGKSAALVKEEIPVTRVKSLPKAAASKKLRLPAEVAADPTQQILDAVVVPPTRGGATAVAVLDTASGETRTLVRERPRPLLSLERGGEAGIRYGLAAGGNQAALYVRQDLARAGNLYLALYGEATTRPEGRAMVELSVRW
jgi:hypothetical protein